MKLQADKKLSEVEWSDFLTDSSRDCKCTCYLTNMLRQKPYSALHADFKSKIDSEANTLR